MVKIKGSHVRHVFNIRHRRSITYEEYVCLNSVWVCLVLEVLILLSRLSVTFSALDYSNVPIALAPGSLKIFDSFVKNE